MRPWSEWDTSVLNDRVSELLGGPVPDEPAVAERRLRARIRELDDERRRQDRVAATLPAVLAALSHAEHDITMRSSPDLRTMQQRAELLRLRLHTARARADRIVLNLAHWQEAIRRDHADRADRAEEEEVDDTDEEAIRQLPAMIRMQQILDEYAKLRQRTDRIGKTDDASR